ncbi:hypothetical protein PXO_05518 [Xanthomonas oryzae pv. oryzae PXO99A]|uniref:Uncharacterized protein n=1 Tax=Xanthomonas oryzae pv. oryzae (strain PXO99A) TaxID=360094 RepID=A0A0K0GI90_XANOP|nr:hypothetical protein PXO_05518 [Xanthomonas oryzae pv. oryzae PXO99A]
MLQQARLIVRPNVRLYPEQKGWLPSWSGACPDRARLLRYRSNWCSNDRGIDHLPAAQALPRALPLSSASPQVSCIRIVRSVR